MVCALNRSAFSHSHTNSCITEQACITRSFTSYLATPISPQRIYSILITATNTYYQPPNFRHRRLTVWYIPSCDPLAVIHIHYLIEPIMAARHPNLGVGVATPLPFVVIVIVGFRFTPIIPTQIW